MVNDHDGADSDGGEIEFHWSVPLEHKATVAPLCSLLLLLLLLPLAATLLMHNYLLNFTLLRINNDAGQACWPEWLTYFIVSMCTTTTESKASLRCASFVCLFASLAVCALSAGSALYSAHRSSLAHISSHHNDRWRRKQKPNSAGQIKLIGSVQAPYKWTAKENEKNRHEERSRSSVCCLYPPSVIHYRELHPLKESKGDEAYSELQCIAPCKLSWIRMLN